MTAQPIGVIMASKHKSGGGWAMELTTRETWTLIHGLVIGSAFLLAFAGGLAGLWSLRPAYVTVTG